MGVKAWVPEGGKKAGGVKERGRVQVWATESENPWGSSDGWGLSRLRIFGWKGPPLLMAIGGWEERSRQELC